MDKLKHKLKFALDLGVNFLLRSINDEGVIADEKDIHRHCLATLCLVENIHDPSTKIELALSRIASYTYSDKRKYFIDEASNDTNSLAAMIFFMTNKKEWGIKFVNALTDEDNSGICCQAFTRAYEVTQEKRWFERAKACAYRIVENGKLDDYWNMIALTYLGQYVVDEAFRNFTVSMLSNCPTFEMYVNYGIPFGNDWEESIEKLAYEKLDLQRQPSDEWNGGAFLDEYAKELRGPASQRFDLVDQRRIEVQRIPGREPDSFPIDREDRQSDIVENYLEATGLIMAMKTGVSPESIHRPLDYTKVLNADRK